MKSFLRLLLFCAIAGVVRANDTSLHEGRWGPEALGGPDGPESPVRMMHEELRVEFGAKVTNVEARFTFRNLESQPVRQIVGFPDLGAAQREQLRRDRERDPKANFEFENSTGPLLQMKTFVDGKVRPSALRYGAIALDRNQYPLPFRASKGETTRLMAWHALEVDFPPGKDVTDERHYRVRNAWQIYEIAFFEYTTATGGVWRGTIGQLTADVILQDGLKVADLAWNDATLPKVQRNAVTMKPAQRRDWQIVSPTHLRLVWKDFEPRTETARRGFVVARKAQWKAPPEDKADE